MRNSRTPAGFRPNGWPFGVPSRCRLGTFESAKSKEMDGWGMRNGASPAGCRHARAGQRCGGALPQVTARWARMRNSRTLAGFRPNGWPFGVPSRCRLSTFESAIAKRWMGGACETAHPQQDAGMHGLAKDAVVLSLQRAGKHARQS